MFLSGFHWSSLDIPPALWRNSSPRKNIGFVVEIDFDFIRKQRLEVKMTQVEAHLVLPQFRKYLTDPDFKYVDFAQREDKQLFPTARIQVSGKGCLRKI